MSKNNFASATGNNEVDMMVAGATSQFCWYSPIVPSC